MLLEHKDTRTAWEALKILIADDHDVVRKGLKEILREATAPTLVSEAADGLEAATKAIQDDWDVIVLDITMPGQSGLEVLRQVKQCKPDVPVLMLSGHTGEHYVYRSLRDGAAGYLSKESAPDELLTAIEAALEGNIYLSHSLRHLARGPETARDAARNGTPTRH
jgi:two-component system, NarL family, invasion response regulator UvrY